MPADDQSATIAFLTAASGPDVADVRVVETHISLVVLTGARAFKLKRAVRLPYLDFSTVALRLAACEQELDLNRRTAPMLYRAVRRITRAPDGGLMFDGPGELVDAVVEMARFDEDTLFDRLATRGALTPALCATLARTIARFHDQAAVDHGGAGAANIAAVLTINEQTLATTHLFAPSDVAAFNAAFRAALASHAALLDARARAGKVRRCHGDLHLRNICLVDGVPTLFDCIEFDAAMATIDVLYDLAFLLMDLWHRELADSANLVLNRYLDECDEADGLTLLPFFMAIRAAVRAHVAATQADDVHHDDGRQRLADEARAYFDLALSLLKPVPARLIAVGGLSGSGKSTIATAIAARIGAPPGARILSTDRIRKRLHGVAARTQLPPEAYRPDVSARVYALQADAARAILVAGHAVIAEAVFDRPEGRARIAQSAADAGVPFAGIWLTAAPATLLARVDVRVNARKGAPDAASRDEPSDATPDVVRAQLARRRDPVEWTRIDADAPGAVVVARVMAGIAEHCGAPRDVSQPGTAHTVASPERSTDFRTKT